VTPRSCRPLASLVAIIAAGSVLCLASCGGGTSSTGAHVGFSGRTPLAVAGLGTPVSVGGSCVVSYEIAADGLVNGQQDYSLTLSISQDPANPGDLVIVLSSDPSCVSQANAAVATVTAKLGLTGNPGALTVWYLTASGRRLPAP